MDSATIDGTTVPVTIAKDELEGYTGAVPDVIDVDRIFQVNNERLLGWAWTDDSTLVEIEYASMEAHHYPNPERVKPMGTAVWDRPERVESELVELLSYDITPANAIDYWAVKMRGYDRTEWGKIRGVDNAAVARNFNMAKEEIEGDEE